MAFKSDRHRKWYFANRGNNSASGNSGSAVPSFSSREIDAFSDRENEVDGYGFDRMHRPVVFSEREISSPAAIERRRIKDEASELVRFNGEWMSPAAAERQRMKEEASEIR